MCAVERKSALQKISIYMLLDLLCTVKKPLMQSYYTLLLCFSFFNLHIFCPCLLIFDLVFHLYLV